MTLSQYISKKLGRIDPDELNAYRSVIPDSIFVDVKESKGATVIRIKSLDDEVIDDLLVTQASNNQDEIVDMVNDLVLMYRNVPEHYRPYFKRILSPVGSPKKQEGLVLVKH